MRIRERDSLEFLQAALVDVAKRERGAAREVVRDGIRAGNSLAQDYARATSGTHARKYPGTFSSAMLPGFSGFGASVVRGEYGPTRRGQGMLGPVLERGGRFSKAHLNLVRSADRIGPSFQMEVGRMADRLFRDFANSQRALF